MGLMKVDAVGFILMLQKRASHVFLSVGAWFVRPSVSVLARIDMAVRGLWLICDLSISCLKKFVMMIRNELGCWSGKFMRALDHWMVQLFPECLLHLACWIACSKLGAHGGINKICVDYLALGVGISHILGGFSF